MQIQLQHPSRDSAFLAAPRSGDRWLRRHILGGEILEVMLVQCEIGGWFLRWASQAQDVGFLLLDQGWSWKSGENSKPG